MPRYDETGYSVLTVSASDRFIQAAGRSFKLHMRHDTAKSVAGARRRVLETEYDLVIIDAPLTDESGELFALDAVRETNASVLIAVPPEVYKDMLELLTDFGILVVSKPVAPGQLDKYIRLLTAVQNKLRTLRKEIATVREKMDEMRVVNKAKFMLVENKHMTEDEAHRYIGKQAMNNGVSRRRIAEAILEDYE